MGLSLVLWIDDSPRFEREFRGLPSGYVKIAIENGNRNSGFSHEKWWIFP